jgi:Cu/Ag efflux protein CusF
MNKLLTPAIAAFAMLAATFAYAADATGNITKIDAPTRTVTLADGKAYVFATAVDITKLKVGDKVKVTFTTTADGKTNNATAVASAN